MALPEYPNIPIEDYLTLDHNSANARYEYLDGELRMLAGGSVYHSIIAANITGILYGLLGNNSPCTVYNSDIRLQLSKSRYVYPNVTISCDQRDQEQGDTIQYPRIVIEVLSPSTECQSVQEYIMIDSQKISVEIYRREGKNGFSKRLG
jgi:Uma2 family endonuclease